MKRTAILLYVWAQVTDVLTTMIPGGLEDNPFARDAQQLPLVSHLIVIKLFHSLVWALLGWVAWKQINELSWSVYFPVRRVIPWVADSMVVAVCLWLTFGLVHVAFFNLLISLGWGG